MTGRGTLLFTDVDGTLLDGHGRYAMTAAALSPFLRDVSIVLTSSRTVLELSRNQRALGIAGPVVAENGAVIAMPWDDATSMAGARQVIDDRPWRVQRLGRPATEIREAIRAAAAIAGPEYVDQQDIEPTLGRECSVLVRPTPGSNATALEPLSRALTAQGFSVASGGSWLAVTRGADKGTGARAVVEAMAREGRAPRRVAAVGDGDNDVPLLQMAEDRFVIRRDDGAWHPELLAIPGVQRLLPVGIAGWCDVIAMIAATEDPR